MIREEARVREQMMALAAQDKGSTRASFISRRTEKTADGDPDAGTVDSHLGKTLGAVQFRDVWTDTAEVLIKQVGNQLACIDYE